MSNELLNEYTRVKDKLEKLKARLDDATKPTNLSSNDIINSVAVSSEIANELKEIIILLHTTMVTEVTESKLSSYKVNLAIVDATEDVMRLQSRLLDRILELEKNKSKPKDISSFLKLYKGTISVIIVITLLWLLTVIDGSAMDHILDKLPNIIKGVIRA